jgi:hypothetical protein
MRGRGSLCPEPEGASRLRRLACGASGKHSAKRAKREEVGGTGLEPVTPSLSRSGIVRFRSFEANNAAFQAIFSSCCSEQPNGSQQKVLPPAAPSYAGTHGQVSTLCRTSPLTTWIVNTAWQLSGPKRTAPMSISW